LIIHNLESVLDWQQDLLCISVMGLWMIERLVNLIGAAQLLASRISPRISLAEDSVQDNESFHGELFHKTQYLPFISRGQDSLSFGGFGQGIEPSFVESHNLEVSLGEEGQGSSSIQQ
jgi:hypothetical protein